MAGEYASERRSRAQIGHCCAPLTSLWSIHPQADHITAVAEGGGDCGLDNLQTLCSPCHKTETETLRTRLRLNGGKKGLLLRHNGEGAVKGQADIRQAFKMVTKQRSLCDNGFTANKRSR